MHNGIKSGIILSSPFRNKPNATKSRIIQCTNCRYNIVEPEDRQWGGPKDPNRTIWSGMVGMVYRGVSFLVIMNLITHGNNYVCKLKEETNLE